MDSLIKRDISLYNVLVDMLMPLSIYGFGSIESLLNLKRHELEQLVYCSKDKNILDLIATFHGLTAE